MRPSLRSSRLGALTRRSRDRVETSRVVASARFAVLAVVWTKASTSPCGRAEIDLGDRTVIARAEHCLKRSEDCIHALNAASFVRCRRARGSERARCSHSAKRGSRGMRCNLQL